jgi:hypothetical protein
VRCLQRPHVVPRKSVRSLAPNNRTALYDLRSTPHPIRRYLAPLQAFLANYGAVPAKQQLVAYVDASRRAHETYGTSDPNAAVLYGLSLLSLAFYSTTELAEGSPNMRLASALQQQVLISSPSHPGALHFLIHSVDQPSSTPSLAVSAAEAYVSPFLLCVFVTLWQVLRVQQRRMPHNADCA